MTGGHDINDPELVRYMIDWVEDVGLNPTISDAYTSFYPEGYAPGLIVGLHDRVEKQGGTVMLSTKVKEIIMKDGVAAGTKSAEYVKTK